MSHYDGWRDYVARPRGAIPVAPARPRKYRNDPTTIDGHTFPSQREANRYLALLVEQNAGAIAHLELQPKYALHVVRPDGVRVDIGVYRADFRYVRAGAVVVEDAKGVRTDSYQLRKRHVEAEYGITVVEV